MLLRMRCPARRDALLAAIAVGAATSLLAAAPVSAAPVDCPEAAGARICVLAEGRRGLRRRGDDHGLGGPDLDLDPALRRERLRPRRRSGRQPRLRGPPRAPDHPVGRDGLGERGVDRRGSPGWIRRGALLLPRDPPGRRHLRAARSHRSAGARGLPIGAELGSRSRGRRELLRDVAKNHRGARSWRPLERPRRSRGVGQASLPPPAASSRCQAGIGCSRSRTNPTLALLESARDFVVFLEHSSRRRPSGTFAEPSTT